MVVVVVRSGDCRGLQGKGTRGGVRVASSSLTEFPFKERWGREWVEREEEEEEEKEKEKKKIYKQLMK